MSATGFLFVAVRQLEERLVSIEEFLSQNSGYVPPVIGTGRLFAASLAATDARAETEETEPLAV